MKLSLSVRCSGNLLSGQRASSVASALPILMRLSGATGPLEFDCLQHAHAVIEQAGAISYRISRTQVNSHYLPDFVA